LQLKVWSYEKRVAISNDHAGSSPLWSYILNANLHILRYVHTWCWGWCLQCESCPKVVLSLFLRPSLTTLFNTKHKQTCKFSLKLIVMGIETWILLKSRYKQSYSPSHSNVELNMMSKALKVLIFLSFRNILGIYLNLL